jgi:hypothetical protein
VNSDKWQEEPRLILPLFTVHLSLKKKEPHSSLLFHLCLFVFICGFISSFLQRAINWNRGIDLQGALGYFLKPQSTPLTH